MATQSLSLLCDNSSAANFKSWAQPIDSWFSTTGWTQSPDTGQVNWSTISSIPSAGSVYTIWEPGDGLHAFYLKLEYGSYSSTTQPTFWISIGEGTDGAGNLTGYKTNRWASNGSYGTQVGTFNCYFSGDTGRIHVMMWAGAGYPVVFSIERSVNSSGAYTGTYVTQYMVGSTTSGRACQQSLVFGVGASIDSSVNQGNNGELFVRGNAISDYYSGSQLLSLAFNGMIPIDFPAPLVGYFDYPCTGIGVGAGNDLVNEVTFTATVYGTLHTYVPCNKGYLANALGTYSYTSTCLRYD